MIKTNGYFYAKDERLLDIVVPAGQGPVQEYCSTLPHLEPGA